MAHNPAGHSTLCPRLGLLNHFEILNSPINILWRARDSDQAHFSPGRVLAHGDLVEVNGWRGWPCLGRTVGLVLTRVVI